MLLLYLVDTTMEGGPVYRVSQEGAALGHWWPPYLISFTAPKYQMREAYGGYCELAFGSFELAQDTFNSSQWPPPRSLAATLYYTELVESEAVVALTTGTAYLTKHTKESITYSLYGGSYDVNMLSTDTDYQGKTDTALPLAIGDVQYVQPVRLADTQSGNQVYSRGDLAGTKHVNWHVYDDGVDVCSNVTNVTDTTWEYTVQPVGTISVSGTGTLVTLDDVAAYVANALGLAYDNTLALDPSPELAVWVSAQSTMIDLLSQCAAWCTHLFYIYNGTLFLVNMGANNGERAITEWEYFEAPYGYPSPVSKWSVTWKERAAGTWSAPSGGAGSAVYVKETDKSYDLITAYPYGEDRSITPMTWKRDDIVAAIAAINEIYHKVRMDIKIPLDATTLPKPGLYLSWLDESFAYPVRIQMHAHDITYDLDNMEVQISGHGEVTAG